MDTCLSIILSVITTMGLCIFKFKGIQIDNEKLKEENSQLKEINEELETKKSELLLRYNNLKDEHEEWVKIANFKLNILKSGDTH